MKNRMMKRVGVGLVLGGLVACGGGHASEEHASSEHATTSSGEGGEHASASVELHNACVLMMHREGECADAFIPALVALRARMDHPAGFAARDAADHEALITQAMQEYAHDATTEHNSAVCRETSELPADRTTGWATTIDGCLALTDCQAFVDCDIRFTEARFQDRIQHDAEHAAAIADAGTPPPATTTP